MYALDSLAKSVPEKPDSDFQGSIRELHEKKLREVEIKLPLLWETICRFLASDYTICLRF
jgi:hypothetical protein